jgi:hypothetical protein
LDDPDDPPIAPEGIASCGKSGFKGERGVAAHELNCGACRELHGLEPIKRNPRKKSGRKKKR